MARLRRLLTKAWRVTRQTNVHNSGRRYVRSARECDLMGYESRNFSRLRV